MVPLICHQTYLTNNAGRRSKLFHRVFLSDVSRDVARNLGAPTPAVSKFLIPGKPVTKNQYIYIKKSITKTSDIDLHYFIDFNFSPNWHRIGKLGRIPYEFSFFWKLFHINLTQYECTVIQYVFEYCTSMVLKPDGIWITIEYWILPMNIRIQYW